MTENKTVGLEANTGVRSVLQFAWAYELFQRSVGKNKLRRSIIEKYLQPNPGDRVLDFGCGPGDLVPFLPEVDFVGYDISDEYIRAAERRFGTDARFYAGSLSDLGEAEAPFDTIVSVGVLHHIPDDIARTSLQALTTLLKPGGRFIAFEPHLHDEQHWIARELIKRDRGQFVRAESEYAELLASEFDDVSIVQDEQLLRVPYSLIAFTCQVR